MIGHKLAHYHITAAIGSGGMGDVYRATDTKLGREVALKVLPDEMATNPDRLARFQREAKALAALDHPGIVTVYSVEEADGVHFLTMQLVEGQPLDELLTADGMPVETISHIGVALTEALGAAHDKGIIHRDLKPSNVMVARDGRVKILDFGLARMTGSAPVGGSQLPTEMLTRDGAVMGTVPYMSPEQVQGLATDHRTDIFSLGVLLYEMAGGRRPFIGSSAAELGSAILRDTPPALTALRSGLPEDLNQIVARCLEKNPGARFQSARDVHDALAKLESDPQGAPKPGSGLRSRRFLIVPALAVLTAVSVLVMRFGIMDPDRNGQTGDAGSPIRSIAVLPLDNYSGDPNQDYFAEGMTDELTADLARISRLRVISRGSAMQFKGEDRPPTPEIARVLDIDALVEGSVLRSGDRVRITVQLIDARTDRHLWADSFQRASKDILALQDELASAIAQEIHVQLTPAEQSRFGNAPTVNPEAYDAYLKGRYFFNRPSDANLQKAIGRFEEAIALAPNFAPALSGLSDAYLWAGFNEGFLTASEARPKAKEAAERAIRLDDNSAEAHTSLAVFKLFYDYDWTGSEAEFRRAFALNPNYAYAHDQFSLGLAFQGRFEESIAEGRRATELDPLNPQIPLDATFAFAWMGDLSAARDLIARAEDLDPTYFLPVWGYGWLDVHAGKVQDAIPHFQEAKAMEAPAFVSAWLAYAYGASGDSARAKAELEDLKTLSLRGSITPFNLALVSLGRGDKARAITYLEQAYASDSQWLGWLKEDRVFDPLRSDPRFVELMKKIGLAS